MIARSMSGSLRTDHLDSRREEQEGPCSRGFLTGWSKRHIQFHLGPRFIVLATEWKAPTPNPTMPIFAPRLSGNRQMVSIALCAKPCVKRGALVFSREVYPQVVRPMFQNGQAVRFQFQSRPASPRTQKRTLSPFGRQPTCGVPARDAETSGEPPAVWGEEKRGFFPTSAGTIRAFLSRKGGRTALSRHKSRRPGPGIKRAGRICRVVADNGTWVSWSWRRAACLSRAYPLRLASGRSPGCPDRDAGRDPSEGSELRAPPDRRRALRRRASTGRPRFP